jgi:hypothetical protein
MEQRAKVEGENYYHLVYAKDKIYCVRNFSRSVAGSKIVAFNAINGQIDSVIETKNPITGG